jgi:DNA polymerase
LAGASSAEWVAVLKSVNYPTDVVVIDFETYFDSTYSMGKDKLSTVEYIRDPRWEEFGFASIVARGELPYQEQRAHFWDQENAADHLKWLQFQFGENLERCTVVIQNARFDASILAWRHGINPPYVVDTQLLSRYLDSRNSHHLKDLCERWNLPSKGDTMQFSGVHPGTATDEQWAAMIAYSDNDADREWDLFRILLPKLDNARIELALQRHTLRLFIEPELAVDETEADAVIALMQEEIVKVLADLGHTQKEIGGTNSFVALLAAELAKTGEAVPMKEGKKGLIAALAKDDDALKNLLIHRNPQVRALVKARQAIKSWPLHIKRVQAIVRHAKAFGGLLPNPLNYYGAHTGRWSGAEGINTCNLPTRGNPLACRMKHILVAPPGKVLVMADAAQIEARGVAWIAGEAGLIASFANDQDVYSDFAADVFAAPCHKPRKDDPPSVAKVLSARRAAGKVGILGMGYGMGTDRAFEYMQTYPELAPKVESGEIDLLFCKRVVDTYRNKFRMIPKFWRDIEDAFRFTTRYGEARVLRGLEISRRGHTTLLRLPSGRCLFYPHAAVATDGNIRFRWGKLWGGTLTENVVQAMSRDILTEALLFVEEHGFRVGHHVYDSLIVAVPEDQDTLAFACVCEALKRCPAWATGWPLNVEATIGRRYE